MARTVWLSVSVALLFMIFERIIFFAGLGRNSLPDASVPFVSSSAVAEEPSPSPVDVGTPWWLKNEPIVSIIWRTIIQILRLLFKY
jgi:hypothetical protein